MLRRPLCPPELYGALVRRDASFRRLQAEARGERLGYLWTGASRATKRGAPPWRLHPPRQFRGGRSQLGHDANKYWPAIR